MPHAVRQASASRPDGQLRVRLWLRLLASTEMVLVRLRCGLRDEFGITLSAFDLMAQIQRPPRGPTMIELSRRLLVTKSNVSDGVERLEAKKLVERRPDPDDARLQHIHLAPAGEDLLARIMPRHRVWIEEMLGAIDEPMAASLYDELSVLKAAISRAANQAGKSGRHPRTTRRPT